MNKKESIKIISNWNELPLSKFLEIGDIDREMNPVEQQTAIISILTGIPEDDLMNLPINEYTKLSKKIQFLYKQPNPVPSCPERITINYHRYEVAKEIRKWTTAQYIDYQAYAQDTSLNNIPQLLTVALIPVGHKYNDGYDLDEVKDDVLHLDVMTVVNMSAFFLRLLENWLRAILISSSLTERRMRRTMNSRGRKNSKRSSTKDGDGQHRSNG